MILITQFSKSYIGKRYTPGKSSTVGTSKPLMGGVAIFLQIVSGRRADGDRGGIALGRVDFRQLWHCDVGRQAKNFDGESRDVGNYVTIIFRGPF